MFHFREQTNIKITLATASSFFGTFSLLVTWGKQTESLRQSLGLLKRDVSVAGSVFRGKQPFLDIRNFIYLSFYLAEDFFYRVEIESVLPVLFNRVRLSEGLRHAGILSYFAIDKITFKLKENWK